MFPLKLHSPAASEFVLYSLSLPILLFEHVLITLFRCCGNAWEYWTCTLVPSWWVICLKSEQMTLSTKSVEKQSGRYDAGSGTEQSSNLVLEGKEKNMNFSLYFGRRVMNFRRTLEKLFTWHYQQQMN